MVFSPERLQTYLPHPALGIWWVAFSGGLDSCVLLHALAALKLPVELRALHVNHQISPNANDWQAHCEVVCRNLSVACVAVKIDVIKAGRGLEDAARDARYQVFEQHLREGDVLFTAHHADDQAETLLLRLMRGAGPRGLAAMSRSRSLGRAQLYRPLLDFTRTELEAYATQQSLIWVNDESNADDHYDRNFLRNQVLPLLRERWPHMAQKWQQTAELCAANESLIDELAAQDLVQADLRSECVGTSISLGALKTLSIARRHNLLRHWLRGEGLSLPEQLHLAQFEQQIIHGRQDAETQVNWAEVSMRVFRGRLYALPLADLPRVDTSSAIPFELVGAQSIPLPTGTFLRCELADRGELGLDPDLPDLQVSFRQGGERCKPAGRAHSQTLKRLLQNYAVEPWLREALPLIYSGDTLVAVSDLWICEGCQVPQGGYKLRHLWRTEKESSDFLRK